MKIINIKIKALETEVSCTVARLNGKAGASSYSAASKSWRWAPLKNLGRKYCLTGTNSMIINGNMTPAIGTQVSPKHISKYTVWKIVNIAIVLKGTVSTKVAWYSSRTLQARWRNSCMSSSEKEEKVDMYETSERGFEGLLVSSTGSSKEQ